MIIDTDRYEAAGIKFVDLPGGEMHVEIPAFSTSNVHVFAKIRSWHDAGRLAFLLDALFRQDIQAHLFIPYFPGARQDRVQPGFALSTQLYADLLFRAKNVTVTDIHSDKALTILRQRRTTGTTHTLPFESFIPDLRITKPDVVLAPDAGARERAETIAGILGVKRVVHCEKKRDPQTGAILGLTVPEEIADFTGRILIADDICDGGRTFIEVANAIKRTAKNMYNDIRFDLYVTHGIFSKGLGELVGAGIKQFHTTDSFYRPALDTEPSVRYVSLVQPYLEGLTP